MTPGKILIAEDSNPLQKGYDLHELTEKFTAIAATTERPVARRRSETGGQ